MVDGICVARVAVSYVKSVTEVSVVDALCSCSRPARVSFSLPCRTAPYRTVFCLFVGFSVVGGRPSSGAGGHHQGHRGLVPPQEEASVRSQGTGGPGEVVK